MREPDLQALWQQSNPPPRNFEPRELEARRVAGDPSDCAAFQVALLEARERRLLVRLVAAGLGAAVAFVSLSAALGDAALTLPARLLGALAAAALGAGAASRRFLQTARLLWQVRGAQRPEERRIDGLGGRGARAAFALAAAVTLVAGGSYWAGATRAARHRDQERAEKLALALGECREAVAASDWRLADGVCTQVLETNPRHEEAAALVARARFMRGCGERLSSARGLAAEPEAALELYASIEPDCQRVFERAQVEAAAPLSLVLEGARAQCLEAFSARRWAEAKDRCGVYAKYACQRLAPEERAPPPGRRLNLDGVPGERDWRPGDPALLAFLRARATLEPSAPPWTCPVLAVLRPGGAPSARPLASPYQSPALARAAQLYAEGAVEKARVAAAEVRDGAGDDARSAAEAFLRDLAVVVEERARVDEGLRDGRPDRVEPDLVALVAADERLTGDEARDAGARAARASRLRTTLGRAMADAYYVRGKELADRRDMRAACGQWKRGYVWSRESNDLLRALTNVCTREAAARLGVATTCEALGWVLDFAVDGDGVAEDVQRRRAVMGCR